MPDAELKGTPKPPRPPKKPARPPPGTSLEMIQLFEEPLKTVFLKNKKFYAQNVEIGIKKDIELYGHPNQTDNLQEQADRFNAIVGDGSNYKDMVVKYWDDRGAEDKPKLTHFAPKSPFSNYEDDNVYAGYDKGFLLHLYTDIQLQKLNEAKRGAAFNDIINAHAETIRTQITKSIMGDEGEYILWDELLQQHAQGKPELNAEAILALLENNQAFNHNSSKEALSEIFKTVLNIEVAQADIDELYIENQVNYVTQSKNIDPVLQGFILEQTKDYDKREQFERILNTRTPDEIQFLIENIHNASNEDKMATALGAFGLVPSPQDINTVLEQMRKHQLLDRLIENLPSGYIQDRVDAQKEAVFDKIRGEDAETIRTFFQELTNPQNDKEQTKQAMARLGLVTDDISVTTFYAKTQYHNVITAKYIDPTLRALIRKSCSRDLATRTRLEGILSTKTPVEINSLLEGIYRATQADQMKAAFEALGIVPSDQEVAVVLKQMHYYQAIDNLIKNLPEGLDDLVGNQEKKIFEKIQGKTPAEIEGLFGDLKNPTSNQEQIKTAMDKVGLDTNEEDVSEFFTRIQYARIRDSHPILKRVLPGALHEETFQALSRLTLEDINAKLAILADASKPKAEIGDALGRLGILERFAAPARNELFAEHQYQRILGQLAASPNPGLLYDLWGNPTIAKDIKEQLKTFDDPATINHLVDEIKNGKEKANFIPPLAVLGFQPDHINQFFGRKQLELILPTLPLADHPELQRQVTLEANKQRIEEALGEMADTQAVRAAFALLRSSNNNLAQTEAAMKSVGLPLGGVTFEKLHALYAENKFPKLLDAIRADANASNFVPPLAANAQDREIKNWLRGLVANPHYGADLKEIDINRISPENVQSLKTAILAQQAPHAAANIAPLLDHMFPGLPKLRDFVESLNPDQKNALMANDQAQLKALIAAKDFRTFTAVLNACGVTHNKDNTAELKGPEGVYAEVLAHGKNAHLQNAALARALGAQDVYLTKIDIDKWNKDFSNARTPDTIEAVIQSVKHLNMYRWNGKKITLLSPQEKAALLDEAGHPFIDGQVASIKNERIDLDNRLLHDRMKVAIADPKLVGQVAVLNTLIRMEKKGSRDDRLDNNDINNIIAAIEDAPNYAEFCAPTPPRLDQGIQALDKSCPNWKTVLTAEKFIDLKQRLEAQKVLNLGKYDRKYEDLIEADQKALKAQEKELGGETRAWYRTHGKGDYDPLAIDKDTLKKLGSLHKMPWLDPQFQASAKQYAEQIKPRVEELKVRCEVMLRAYKNDRNDVQKRLDRLPTVEEAKACAKFTPQQIKILTEHRAHLEKRQKFLDKEIEHYQKAHYVINGDPVIADRDSFRGMGLLACIDRAQKGQFIKVVGTSWRCESVTPEVMADELRAIKEGKPIPSANLASYDPNDPQHQGIDPMVARADGLPPTGIIPRYVTVPVPETPGPYRITVGKENPNDPQDVGFFYMKETKDGSGVTLTEGQFPKTNPERVLTSMLKAKLLLERTPIGSTPKIDITNGSEIERKFLWTALMLLSNTKGMKFGHKDIGGDDFSNRWGNIDKDSEVYKAFKEGPNWMVVEENQTSMQQFADNRDRVQKASAGYVVEGGKAERISKEDITKKLNPTTQYKQINKDNKQAYDEMLAKEAKLKDKGQKEEVAERLSSNPRGYR